MSREINISRKTKETDITLTLDMDNKGVEIDTPVPFFNHMLTAMAFHGGFALKIKASGDVDVDAHHIVEGAFKSVARSLKQAVAIDKDFADEIPSTKGVL